MIAWDRSWIAHMAIFRSGERSVRPKAGAYVSWAIPDNGNLWVTRGAVGDFEFAVSIIPVGTYIQA